MQYGTVARVDFYADNNLISTSTVAPYSFVWTNAPAGTHTFTAIATDNQNGATKSAPLNVIVNSQPPAPGSTAGALWAVNYDGPSNRTEDAPAMAVDTQGNVYVAGGSIGIGTEYDVATVKYDTSGHQLWVARYAGLANDIPRDIAIDAQGNVYVTADTWRGFNFDGGTETDIVTLKYNAQGTLLWQKYYTGTQRLSWQDTPSELGLDANGNVYVAGMTYRSNMRGVLVGMSVVVKYDANGNEVWVRTYDSPLEYGAMANHIVVDASGASYITGGVNIHNPNTNSEDDDIYTIKYDAAGNVVWQSFFDSPDNASDFDTVSGIRVDAQGSVYLAGSSRPIMGQGSDFLTIKYNANGSLAWSRYWDLSYLDGAADLAVDSAGSVYVVGGTEIRHDGGLPNDDVVTIKYDANGQLQWTRVYNPFNKEEGAQRVLLDQMGNAYVGIETQDESGNYVFGVLKYSAGGAQLSVNTYRGMGGGGTDLLSDMAFDGAGSLYLTGTSFMPGGSTDFLTMKVAAGTLTPPPPPQVIVQPVISWNNPANITYGTPLSSVELNATANVPGTFQYNPTAGTILAVGTHQLSVTFTPTDTTNYSTATKNVTLTVNPVASATLGFSSAAYTVNEGTGSIAITVNRSGNTSGASTVNYTTADNSGLNACSSVTGMASSRCDYASSIGTLRFAAGETSKTIYIPIIDYNIADGTEIFALTLGNPIEANLGTINSATITITDNANTQGNPIDDVPFFVREHYIDFLGREPDQAGLAGWQNVLNNCGVTIQQPCDKIEVSAGFFRSPEFQDRGYFIYRFYSAVGKIPLYEGFMPDLAKVSGFLSAQQLEENKVAFVNQFMARPDFQTKYGALTDPTSYVDALLQTVGLPNHPQRNFWIASLTNGSLTRGQVLRSLVESTEVYQKYYNEAFVIMQYFGYLRRSADISYLQWIQTMNETNEDYRTMINGFLNSAEYRQRFGQ